MESNAAAAMARFKTFRSAGKDEPTPSPSTRSDDLPDSPIAKEMKSELPPPDAAAGNDINGIWFLDPDSGIQTQVWMI